MKAYERETTLDIESIRRDFPALHQKVHGSPLVYLDNAATAQKPRQVIESMVRFYQEDCANVHRGVHQLSERATEALEQARVKLRRFVNARKEEEIVFVRGATEAINLVAQTFGRTHLRAGDEVVVSALEHHSNIVPWQMICEEKGAQIKVVPMDDRGVLDLDAYRKLLTPRTRMVAVTHVSNALGTVVPVTEMTRMAHAHGIPVLVDGAQAAPHFPVDVQAVDCDFYCVSGHKVFGPTGIGILYGKEKLLDSLPPYQGGGSMIETVTFERSTYLKTPHRFEAGTVHIAGGIGFGAVVDYLEELGMDRLGRHEHELLEYATGRLGEIPGVRILGTAPDKASVISFLVDDVHPHDVGTILDREGVAIRVGHHCAQPIMEQLGVPATCRASFAFYNTREEVDSLCRAVLKVKEVFG